MIHDPQRARLVKLVQELALTSVSNTGKFAADMRSIVLHHEAAPLVGHVCLDLLEESGFPPEEIDAVGGLTINSSMVGAAVLHAAASRGLELDAFALDQINGRHVGPRIDGRAVVVVMARCGSGQGALVTARLAEQAGAQVLAILSVIDEGAAARQLIESAGYQYLVVLEPKDFEDEAQG
ncbi:MAG: orotate phosphoribosyltransferase [Actinomycetaceae bacterium]|nr:orotate phosphoribosyltransferase [Actinomycetaceae bacterium]